MALGFWMWPPACAANMHMPAVKVTASLAIQLSADFPGRPDSMMLAGTLGKGLNSFLDVQQAGFHCYLIPFVWKFTSLVSHIHA